MRGRNPEADVDVSLGVCDDRDDPPPLTGAPVVFAEPHPGDDGRFLVHARIGLAGPAGQTEGAPLPRDLAASVEREADRIDEEEARQSENPQMVEDEDGSPCAPWARPPGGRPRRTSRKRIGAVGKGGQRDAACPRRPQERSFGMAGDRTGTEVSGIAGEDLDRLLDNPFVESFSGGRITYSRDFNVAMHKRLEAGMTCVEAYSDLGFDVAVLGENRANAVGRRVRRLAASGRLSASEPGSYDGSVPRDRMGELAPEEEIAYLRARNLYLETVIEAQKKLPSLLGGTRTSWRHATWA